jgi:hypothetical protein
MNTARLLEKVRQLDEQLYVNNDVEFKPIKTEPITELKEVEVVRSVVVGKYYEATYLTKKIGLWPNEKYYTTKPRQYVGQYLRHVKQGMGDGADHWYIFIHNGKEIEVELDYEGTRAFHEVSPQLL